MRALVIGIDSTIGKSVAAHWESLGYEVLGTSRRRANPAHLYLDLSDDLSSWTIPEKLDFAAIFAGVTALRDCELDPEGSRRVNVTGTATIARRLMTNGVFVLFPSSNLVFDGTQPDFSESSVPVPRNNYGRHQVEVEEQMLADDQHGAVLRLTKVIPPGFELFVRWHRELSAGRAVHPFHDMWIAPVSLEFTVRLITALCVGRMRGLFQTSGSENISYADAARIIAVHARADTALVQPVSCSTLGIDPGLAPRYGTLNSSRLVAATSLLPPSAKECVVAAIADAAGSEPRATQAGARRG